MSGLSLKTILGITKTEFAVRISTSQKPVDITGLDDNHVKADFIFGSNVNGTKRRILCNFAFDNLQVIKHLKNLERGSVGKN